MKMFLIADLWTMIVSWCLYLNGYETAACALGVIVSMTALFLIEEIDYLRMTALVIAFYTVAFGLYVTSGIQSFFPGLHVFLAIGILNASIANEYLMKTDTDFVLALLSVMAAGMAMFIALIMIADVSDYSLFTRANLVIMTSFIFLPYLIPCLMILGYRVLRPVHDKEKATM